MGSSDDRVYAAERIIQKRVRKVNILILVTLHLTIHKLYVFMLEITRISFQYVAHVLVLECPSTAAICLVSRFRSLSFRVCHPRYPAAATVCQFIPFACTFQFTILCCATIICHILFTFISYSHSDSYSCLRSFPII